MKLISTFLLPFVLFVCFNFSLTWSYSSFAQSGTKTFRSSDEVILPVLSKRKIIGTWLRTGFGPPYSMSIEQVNSKSYRVDRYSGGKGGDTGSELKRINATTFLRPERNTGDKYVILANGHLSVRDNDGEIEQLRPHKTLFP